MRSQYVALLSFAYSVAVAMLASPSRADLPEDCTELGLGLTEHTCFHARFGPFEERAADPGEQASDRTASIDAVHTHFRVRLSDGQGVVTYTPQRTGAWAVFIDPDVPLRILDPAGTEQAVQLSHAVESCPFLPRVRVYTLEQNRRYRFVLGPSMASEVVIVNEKVDDFTSAQGRDRDGDGHGDPNDVVQTPCVAMMGFADNDTDCDDDNAAVHPDAVEICDDVDQNCNLLADDVGATCSVGEAACASTGTWSCPRIGEPAQCSATMSSGAGDETCNGEDDDCDGEVDEEPDARLCGADVDRPRCISTGNGRGCGCERDSDCGPAGSGRLCLLDGPMQRCVSGCVAGRTECPQGQQCTSNDPARPGFCTACCESDLECAEKVADRPYCAPATSASLLMCIGQVIGVQWIYKDGRWQSGPVRTTPGQCVECTRDEHCANREDGRTACIGAFGTCARCNAHDLSRCSASAEGAACLPSGDCGCRSDADCGEDRRCAIERRSCVEEEPQPRMPQAGATAAAGGMAGSAPRDPALLEDDAGSTPVELRDAGAPRDAAAASSPDASAKGSRSGAGCSCQSTGGESEGAGMLLCLFAALSLRRRARAALLALGLILGGCASDAMDRAPQTQAGAPAQFSEDDDAGLSPRSGPREAVRPSPAGSASRNGGSCGGELGDAVLKHSCQHAKIGPHTQVLAAVARELAPPDVHASHTPYRIRLPPQTAEFAADGWVRYRPSRSGQHVFFVGPKVDVRVVEADSEVERSRYHEQPIERCPDVLEYGFVYELEAGAVHWIALRQQSIEVNLFVEHVDTFGSDAWRTRCNE